MERDPPEPEDGSIGRKRDGERASASAFLSAEEKIGARLRERRGGRKEGEREEGGPRDDGRESFELSRLPKNQPRVLYGFSQLAIRHSPTEMLASRWCFFGHGGTLFSDRTRREKRERAHPPTGRSSLHELSVENSSPGLYRRKMRRDNERETDLQDMFSSLEPSSIESLHFENTGGKEGPTFSSTNELSPLSLLLNVPVHRLERASPPLQSLIAGRATFNTGCGRGEG